MDNSQTSDNFHGVLSRSASASHNTNNSNGNRLYTPPAAPKELDSVATSASYHQDDHENDMAAVALKLNQQDETSASASAKSPSSTDNNTTTNDNEEEVLPERLMRLVNEFVTSLREPRYEAPLTPNAISDLFQGFYARFEDRAREYLTSQDQTSSDTEMLAYNEIAARRAKRQERAAKAHYLTLQAENEACKAVYTKIFSVTNAPSDRQRNERLNRRIRVLRELNITLSNLDFHLPKGNEKEIMDNILATKDTFDRLSEDHTPRGKLMAIRDIHRQVVEALGTSSKNMDSAGADCLLPLLIYTCTEFSQDLSLNVKFIKRFRNKNAITSEEAYCMTNLEAVVEFLSTISLSGLDIKPQDIPQGIDLSCFDSPATPSTSSTPDLPFRRRRRAVSDMRRDHDPLMNPPGSPTSSRSSRSNSLQSGTQYDAANPQQQQQRRPDLQSLSSSFGSSYKFLVGRFMGKDDVSNYPDTIDDVRHVLDHDKDRDMSTPSVLGKFVKNLRINSPAPSIDAEAFAKLPVNVSPHLFECETNDLRLADIKQLHMEYKQLIRYLKDRAGTNTIGVSTATGATSTSTASTPTPAIVTTTHTN